MNNNFDNYSKLIDNYLKITEKIELSDMSKSIFDISNKLNESLKYFNQNNLYANIDFLNNAIGDITLQNTLTIFNSWENKINFSYFDLKSVDNIGKSLLKLGETTNEISKIIVTNNLDLYVNQANGIESLFDDYGNELNSIAIIDDIPIDTIDIISRDTSNSLKCFTIDEAEERYNNTITVKIKRHALKLANLLTSIMKMEDNIFIITPNSLKNISTISIVTCDNEEKFALVINALYELIYEGCKSFSTNISSYIKFDDYPIMLQIKHLRKDYDHDIFAEHDFAKKEKQAEEVYEALINKRRPIKTRDFKELQEKIYEKTCSFLEDLSDKISNNIKIAQ